jgi:predicted metalloprotease with PDZ domain
VGLALGTHGMVGSQDYAGNIGSNLLEQFVCTFDYERRKLYLEPGKRYGEPDHFTRAGVQFMRSGDIVRAMQVLPGSPAAAAGLKDDDEVVAIEGKPPLSYSPDELDTLFDEGAPGRKVAVRVTRDGKPKELKITLKDMI